MKAFLFDTYALHELVMGSAAYQQEVEGARVVTTAFNLMELHYILLAKHGLEMANAAYDAFLPAVTTVEDDLIKEANVFRLQWKQRKVSYVDCIGYILAQRLGIPFLTGDKQFENLPNIRFLR
jgi:predicted nucleic acid-binding protein